MSAQPQLVPAPNPLWSSVGSTGIVNLDDMNNVQFLGTIVKLKGSDGPVITTAEKPTTVITTPKVQAVVRYEITPDPGLIAEQAGIALRVYCRRGSGDIQAKLIRVGIPTAPVPSLDQETLITYNNNNTDRAHFLSDTTAPFQGEPGHVPGAPILDFSNNSYYIELTLSGHLPQGPLPNHPPEVALLQLFTLFE